MCRALLVGVALVAALATGCGDDREPERELPGGPLALYVSVPTHGPAAQRGRGVLAGVRRAVRESGGRAGGRDVRVVALSSNRPGDQNWDPGTVEANARRVVDDPRAIAYVGEVDSGGSAISLPRTNRAGLLQVSPADGLTSLTKSPPGKPTVRPARFYPDGKRTFLTLVPGDAGVAGEMLRLADVVPGRRIMLVQSADVAQRELGGILAVRMLRAGVDPVATAALGDDPGDVPGLVDDIAGKRPDAIFLAADRGPAAGALLRGLARRLPAIEVVASPALADVRDADVGSARAVTSVPPLSQRPRAARRLAGRLASPPTAESLYGYDAARLVLGAVRAAGPDRPAVVRAALQAGPRTGVTGHFDVGRFGSVSRARQAVVSLRDGRTRVVPVRP